MTLGINQCIRGSTNKGGQLLASLRQMVRQFMLNEVNRVAFQAELPRLIIGKNGFGRGTKRSMIKKNDIGVE